MKMKKRIVFLAVGASMLGWSILLPVVAFAEHQFLPAFVRQLRRGMSGDDVRILQDLLASDPEVYPEGLVTGFFGPLTENAVRRFQRKHGIDTVGEVGPKTRARLHMFLEERGAEGKRLPPGIVRKIGGLATSTATTTTTSTQGREELKVTVCHKPAGASQQTIVVGIPALAAHIMHGDTVGACSLTSTPSLVDTVAPSISGVTAISIASTSAHITWTTDELSNSTVWYGTSTPVASSTAMMAVNASLVTAHTVPLQGLTESTTYYYRVGSTDGSGNAATSAESSFSTLP